MNAATRLSANFTIAEFIASGTAARKGIDNSLPADLLPEARATAAMLEAIRGFLGTKVGRPTPIVITSGFRCLELNRAIGSRDTSDHTRAQAADIRVPAFGRPAEVAAALAPVVSTLGIGQLILEFPGPNEWVHVSTRRPEKDANRILTATAAGFRLGIVRA